MTEVHVLLEGYHEKTQSGIRISSTVTLIKSDINVIVDTGSFLDKEKIITALENNGISAGDIDAVILTHLHLDHVMNTRMFKNAKVYCKFYGGEYPGQVHDPQQGLLKRFDLLNENIAEDISIIVTPGHTQDMISVVVNTDIGKIVITGDAFMSEIFQDLSKEPDPLFNNVDNFNQSRQKILEIADYVIPGHGKMFKVDK